MGFYRQENSQVSMEKTKHHSRTTPTKHCKKPTTYDGFKKYFVCISVHEYPSNKKHQKPIRKMIDKMYEKYDSGIPNAKRKSTLRFLSTKH